MFLKEIHLRMNLEGSRHWWLESWCWKFPSQQ